MKAMFIWPPAAAGPAVRAARGGLSGRRVQAVVIGLVLLVSTAASTLALGLLVDSNSPFDQAFAAQHGSEVTATAQATTAQLAATAHLPGVTAAAGPFPEGTVTATIPVTPPPGVSGPPGGGVFQTQLTVVGRPSPVQVYIPGVPGQRSGSVVEAGPGPGPAWPSLAAQESAVQAALRAQPGTLHYVAESDDQIGVLGLSDHTNLIGFAGDASWTGYALISGHWYQGAHQVDVNTAFLTGTGLKVGGSDTISSGSRHITVQIAGEIFDPAGGNPEIVGRQSTLATLDPGLSPDQYDVALTPGTSAQAYADALGAGLGQPYQVNANGSNSSQFFVIIGLIAMLTLLLTAVAALGVLNTVVLQTRERVHDLGVFKAVGMTPRQTIAMVVRSVAGIGLVAGLIAIPAGIALHNYVLPVMGHAAQTDVPPSVLNAYHPWEIVLLALAGLVIAVAGALGPAGWAARTPHRVRAARRVRRHSGCRSARPGGPPAGHPRLAARTGRTARTGRPAPAPARPR